MENQTATVPSNSDKKRKHYLEGGEDAEIPEFHPYKIRRIGETWIQRFIHPSPTPARAHTPNTHPEEEQNSGTLQQSSYCPEITITAISHPQSLLSNSVEEPQETVETTISHTVEITPGSSNGKNEVVDGQLEDPVKETNFSPESETNVGTPSQSENTTPTYETEETVCLQERKSPTKVKFHDTTKVRLFKRAVSLCSVPSTGSYPLGLSWDIIKEVESPLIEITNPTPVPIFTEIDRIERLSSSGAIELTDELFKSKRSRRVRGLDVASMETTEKDDQRALLDYIRSSRSMIGCQCAPAKTTRSKKKKTKGEQQPPSCCGKDCECAKNGLRCHIGVCFCADYNCTNTFGRRQLNATRVELDRIRVLQPKLYQELLATNGIYSDVLNSSGACATVEISVQTSPGEADQLTHLVTLEENLDTPLVITQSVELSETLCK